MTHTEEFTKAFESAINAAIAAHFEMESREAKWMKLQNAKEARSTVERLFAEADRDAERLALIVGRMDMTLEQFREEFDKEFKVDAAALAASKEGT